MGLFAAILVFGAAAAGQAAPAGAPDGGMPPAEAGPSQRALRAAGVGPADPGLPTVAAARLAADRMARRDAATRLFEAFRSTLAGEKAAALGAAAAQRRVREAAGAFRVRDVRHGADGSVEVDVEIQVEALLGALENRPPAGAPGR